MSGFEKEFNDALIELEDIVDKITPDKSNRFTEILERQLASITEAVSSLESVSGEISTFVTNAITDLHQTAQEVSIKSQVIKDKEQQNTKLASDIKAVRQQGEILALQSEEERAKLINKQIAFNEEERAKMDEEIKKIKEISAASDMEKTKKINELEQQLSEKIIFCQGEIAEREKLLDRVKAQGEEDITTHKAEIDALNIEIQGLRDRLKHNEDLLATMKDENTSLLIKIKLLEDEGTELNKEKLALQEQIKDLDNLRDKTSREIEELKKENEAELISKASKSAILEKQIRELEAENSRLTGIIIAGTTVVSRVVSLLRDLDRSQNNEGEKASAIESNIKEQIARETAILANIKKELARPTLENFSGDEEPPPDPTKKQKVAELFRKLEKLSSGLPALEEETIVYDKFDEDKRKADALAAVEEEKKRKEDALAAAEEERKHKAEKKPGALANRIGQFEKGNKKGGTRKKRRSTKRIRRRSTKRRCNKKRRTTRRKRRKHTGGYTYSAKTSV